ncbi:MAG: small basic protein [Candidatus Omnitrophota bacterium]|nr:MAG: small basic protein [Candidatus Omnitrophota bacterium]
MSLHPSLVPAKGKTHRSVKKRFERIQKLKKDGKWDENLSAFGLPKDKVIKIKLKKSKGAEDKTATEVKEKGDSKTASKGASKK